MQTILITTLVITVVGIIVGGGLVYTSKKFYVEVDEREAEVRAVLPGNNCGACGYAGCDALAAAIASGEASVNACPVGGNPVAEKIGGIMGIEAEEQERMVAYVRCKGNCEVTKNQANYVGVSDCRAAVLSGMNVSDCSFGCLGLGSCEHVCPQGAIKVVDNVAVVDESKCISCGLCVKTCPRGIIELKPQTKRVSVQCQNRDRGPLVKQVCSAGCIGCTLCTRVCETGAITVVDNLARIDYAKCTQCGKCAEKCPSHVIMIAG